MRNLILILLLCAAGYGLYEWYTGPGSSASGPGSGSTSALDEPGSLTGSTSGFVMPDPVAWKETGRFSNLNGEAVGVALVERNRWRVEVRLLPSSLVIVCVFDGATFASSVPAIKEPIAVDAASSMRNASGC